MAETTPTIVNPSQQMQVGILSPPALYSRNIVLIGIANAALGWQFEKTPALGDEFWLWRVTIGFESTQPDNTKKNLVRIKYGAVGNVDSSNWDSLYEVIPTYHPTAGLYNLIYCEGSKGQEFMMGQRYSGNKHRFYIATNRTGAGSDVVKVTFQISEG